MRSVGDSWWALPRFGQAAGSFRTKHVVESNDLLARVPHPNVAFWATLGWGSTTVCAGGFCLRSAKPHKSLSS